MKYLLVFILIIPALLFGCIGFIWDPTKKGFINGSRWLDEAFNYGKLIEKLLVPDKNESTSVSSEFINLCNNLLKIKYPVLVYS